jgi:MFS family permease
MKNILVNIMEKNKTDKKWLVLIAVALSTFLISLDSTFMSVSLNSLVLDLNTTISTVQMIITFYTLITASLMLITSKLMDIIGKKQVFIIGAVSFGIGTIIATISQNSLMLFIGWSLFEGIGAAFMLPATISIISGTYKDDDLTLGLAIMSALGGIAAAIGPLFGGFVTSFLSWRIGFAVELIIVLVILTLSKNIYNFKTNLLKSDFDIVGSILSIVALIMLVLGILNLDSFSEYKLTLIMIIISIILLVIFYFFEKYRINNSLEPLFDIRILKSAPNLSKGSLIRLISMIGVAGIIFTISLYLQMVMNVDAFTNGLVLMPATIGLLIFSLISTKLVKKFSHRTLISSGFIISIIGLIILRPVFGLDTNLYSLIPGMFIFGAGMGFVNALSLDSCLVNVEDSKQTNASGFITTCTNLGSSLGTALMGTILIIGAVSGLHKGIIEYYPSQISNQQFFSNLSFYVQKMGNVNISSLSGHVSEASQIVNSVIYHAMLSAIDLLIVFMVIGLILSFFLKGKNSIKP